MEWISVKDRLPKPDIIVIVLVFGYADLGWYDENHDVWRTAVATFDEHEVAYWMPLPEPPKEAE